MVDLLAEVTYTRVHGRFIVSEGNNNDPDADPDAVIPQTGKITFTPLVEAVQFADAVPPVTVTQRPIVCELDSEGYVIDSNDKRGVWLVATNDLDGFPVVWGYKVREDFDGVKTPRIYTISVPAGGDVDLASLAPAPESVLVPPSIIELMEGAIAAAAAVTSLIAEDHGSVSGTLLIDEPGSHELDLTGALEVTIETDGDVTLFVHGSGESLVIEEADFEITVDGDAVVMVVTSPRGVQQAYAVGTYTAAVPDTTPPSNLSGLTAGTPTGTTIPFSWSASTDAESTVRYKWRIRAGAGAWSDWSAPVTGLSATATGLAYSTEYTIEVYPYSAGGSATGMTVTATTAAYVPASGDVLTSDSMAGAFDDSVAGRVTDLYAGGIARTWAETGTAGGWDINGTGELTGPSAGSSAARLNYGYAGAAKVEFDIVTAGPNLMTIGIGASLSTLGANFDIGTNQLSQNNVTPASPTPSGQNNIIGYLGEPWAGSSVAGHWIFELEGSDITVTRPDGYVWHGTTSSAMTGTYLVFSATGYTTGGWEIANVKVTSP